MRISFPAFVTAGGLAAVTALAGCGSAGSTATGSAGTSPAAPAAVSSSAGVAAPSSAATAKAGSVTGEQLCALVPVKDADAAMRTSPAVTDQEPGTFVDGEPECGFASADQSVIVNVTIFDPGKTKFDMTHAAVSAATLKPVPGLGTSAGYGSPELDVLFGKSALVVESFGPTDVGRAKLVSLAKIVLSRLG